MKAESRRYSVQEDLSRSGRDGSDFKLVGHCLREKSTEWG